MATSLAMLGSCPVWFRSREMRNWVLSQELTAWSPFRKDLPGNARSPPGCLTEKLLALSTLCVPENTRISLTLFKKYSILSWEVLYHSTGLQS